MVVCGAAYATSLAVPLWFQLHQQRILIVTSGSMAPKFEAGDAVVLRAISDESDLKVGQVISFWPTGSDELVTHRYPLSGINDAFAASVEKPPGFGKATVVLEESLIAR